jgi:hypothetical protein
VGGVGMEEAGRSCGVRLRSKGIDKIEDTFSHTFSRKLVPMLLLSLSSGESHNA